MRRRFIQQRDGSLVEVGPAACQPVRSASLNLEEIDFISPIDRKQVYGRVGLREHNKRHDVESNRDLTGLPTLLANPVFKHTKEDRRSIIETLIPLVEAHGSW